MKSAILHATTLTELNTMINEVMSTDRVLNVNIGVINLGSYFAQLTIEDGGLI